MGKFREIKVKVDSPEQSKAVQEALFKGGCLWAGESKAEVIFTHCKVLFVSKEGRISMAEDYDKEFFLNHRYKLVYPEDIISVLQRHKHADILEAIARGEDVKTQWSDDGVNWKDDKCLEDTFGSLAAHEARGNSKTSY